jgi:lysine 6-dehydrogenase
MHLPGGRPVRIDNFQSEAGQMKIVVLGGLGLQGRAALWDLSRNSRVREIVCADGHLEAWGRLAGWMDTARIRPVQVDASSRKALVALLSQGADAAIDLLPSELMATAFEAAIEARVPIVSTNYGRTVAHLHQQALEAGVALMPECGLDPGIDLVLCGHAVRQFDRLEVLDSYCGGFPEKAACDNPLAYKISWNWDMVLRTQKRDSVFIREGRRLTVPAAEQHENPMIHTIVFPGLGELEAIPNGDAFFYAELLGLTRSLRQAGRYSLRWPGWCAFWAPLKKLGFLSDDPLPGLPCPVSPHQFLDKLLGPRLQYQPHEKDLVAMYNRFEGLAGGRRKKIVMTLVIARDLDTGLLGMNLGVAYPACIVAEMLATGQITAKGLLNPALHVPYAPFMAELSRRGIEIKENVEQEA